MYERILRLRLNKV